jgi:hypothetical protein
LRSNNFGKICAIIWDYDAEGEPLFSFPTTVGGQPLSETFIDDVSINSRWQMQLGLRYIFN